MKEVTIFALGHIIVKINDEAILIDKIDSKSAFSLGTVAHSGCSILVDKVQNQKLKKELLSLQVYLKKQNGFGTILACITKVQK